MGKDYNFTSTKTTLKLSEVFGQKATKIEVSDRAIKDTKQFLSSLQEAYKATKENELQFG